MLLAVCSLTFNDYGEADEAESSLRSTPPPTCPSVIEPLPSLPEVDTSVGSDVDLAIERNGIHKVVPLPPSISPTIPSTPKQAEVKSAEPPVNDGYYFLREVNNLSAELTAQVARIEQDLETADLTDEGMFSRFRLLTCY